jgi:hypothetical protein
MRHDQRQLAIVHSVTFENYYGIEVAHATVVEHPKFRASDEIYTSKVIWKFPNGYFITNHTRYKVVPKPVPAPAPIAAPYNEARDYDNMVFSEEYYYDADYEEYDYESVGC